jgi:hypothetical protein
MLPVGPRVDAKEENGVYVQRQKRRERINAYKETKPSRCHEANVQAANKKIDKLTERVKKLEQAVKKKANK